MSRNTLLMTGTIDSNVFSKNGKTINTKIIDPTTRLKEYSQNIEKYIRYSAFEDIVFIENSSYPFNCDYFANMAIKVGKRFEFLQITLTEKEMEMMIAKGKSYGEASLIDYAMKNSQLISESKVVYKVTGRIFISNSHAIIKNAKRTVSEGICQNTNCIFGEDCWFHTEFFKILKTDYYRAFENSSVLCNDYTKNDEMGTSNNIEQVWYRLAKQNNIQIKCFSLYPNLQGIIGSFGNVKYDKSMWNLFIKTVLCKFGYYSLK